MDTSTKGAIGAGLSSGIQIYMKMKELALAEKNATSTEEYQNKIFEEQKATRVATQEMQKMNAQVGKMEQVTKLLNAAGGITMSSEKAEKFSESYGVPKEFFRKELDKDGKPTENYILHDPDSQANMMKMLKMANDSQKQALDAYGVILSLEKFRLFKDTPSKTITTDEGIMGIYPGGETRKLGKRAPGQVSAGERTKIAEEEAGIEALNRIESMVDEAYVGPIKGRIGQLKDIWGGNSQKQSEFYAAIASLKNSTIKLITGAQMSEVEAKRIMKEIPDISNPLSVLKARLNQTRINRKMLLKKRKEQAGIKESTDKSIGQMTTEELQAIINGE